MAFDRSKSEFMELSMVQQDIYFDQLHYPNSPLYNVGGYINLPAVDVERLLKAHRLLISRHDAFGLRIAHCNDSVGQYISNERTLDLCVHDFSHHNNPKAIAEDWLQHFFQEIIAIENAELFRVYLLKISNENWFYVGMAHHISMDGWGFANWAERLGAYYCSCDVKETAKPWIEVIEKEKTYVQGVRYQKDKAYWRAQLHELPEPMLAPNYYQNYRHLDASPSQRKILPVSAVRHLALTIKAKEIGVAVSQLYQALIAIYFNRCYGIDELVMGFPVHNRSDRAEKNTLGTFMSVIPIRLQIDVAQSFAEFCGRIKSRMRMNFKHQRYPAGEMRREFLGGSERRALFEVGYNYLKLDSKLDFDGKSAYLVYLSHNHEQTPINFIIWEYGEHRGVEIQVDHNLVYFSEPDVDLLVERFDYLITQVLEKNINVNSDLQLIPEKEKAAILSLSYGDALSYSQEYLAHQLFEQQVLVNAKSIALLCNGQEYSFEELNCRVNSLANYLLRKGCRSGDFIGIHCSRSVNMVVAILAIMKVGATFVSLDPEYPEARLNYIVQDCAIRIVLAESNTEPAMDKVEVITLDMLPELEQYASGNPDITVSAEQAAYVFYTSGSTGKPKGVLIRHRSLLALLHWARVTYKDEQLSSILASTSLNFDLSIYELFVPLCFGFKCVLVKNALALLEEELPISLVNTVPSAAKSLLQHNAIPSSVNTVNLCGEPLPMQVVNGLLETTSCQSVYNLYGPSEDTTYSTCACFKKPIEGVPDIGKVIANSQSWVLSSGQELLPIGCVGELVLSGDGVAAGYLNRPELTVEKFIELSWVVGPCYRTGDLVRYQSNDTLAFIGRIDDQVKLRGFRIEPGEIEHALVAIPQVREAIVMVIEDGLVAYLVSPELETSTIKEQLQQSLPHHMVPEHFVFMNTLPLTPNGKIDKKALPKPELQLVNTAIALPDGKIENKLRALVAQVLELDAEQISMNASFFELGGHSLLAVNLVGRIRKTFAASISIKELFEAASLRRIADTLSKDTEEVELLPNIVRVENASGIPLSLNQHRLWFIDKVQEHSKNYNMPFALQLTGYVDPEVLEQALSVVVDRHEVLRTVYKEDEAGVKQSILPASHFVLEVLDLLPLLQIGNRSLEEELQIQIQQRIDTSFALAHKLPIKVTWFNCGENQKGKACGLLLLNVHHIAFDGWSIEVFLAEFKEAYRATSEHEVINLPVLPVQYSDYAFWQNQLLEQNNYDVQLSYWKSQLQGAPLRHSLPTKISNQASTEVDIATITQQLDPELLDKLFQLVDRQNMTLFMQLHAALVLLLSRHSNSNDIVIGTPVANRGQLETQSLIGFFVNTLALRVNTALDTVEAYLEHVRSVNLLAQDNQQVPFDKVVEACRIERSVDYTPLFQILFTLNEFSSEQLQLPRIQVEQKPIAPRFKKFDLEIETVLDGTSMQVNWIYDVKLFDEIWINKLSKHFVNLLQQLVQIQLSGSTTEMQVAHIAMLSEEERWHLLHKINDTILAYPKQATLVGLFEQQARQRSDQVALSCHGKTWSFRELNQLANGLAYELHELGIAVGDMVGVACRRNMDMVVALLATLKIGASYVPLDPDYPISRRDHIIKDSLVKVLLTHAGFKFELNIEQKLVLDEKDLIAKQIDCNPKVEINPDSVAYAIYTSGSTGLPKGVAIRHRNAVAMLYWANSRYTAHELQRVLASTSLSFDLSIFELFLPLCFGYQCVLVDSALALLEEQPDITLINTVPSAIKVLVEQHAIPSSTAVVNLAGEPLKTELVNQILALGVSKVCNLYGPSEDTTYSTYSEFTVPIERLPEIGKVINNSQSYILSEQTVLLPFGVAGELYLGGDGVAKGYINQPQLTAEKFIPNPFGDGFLYRTGDLVRYCTQEGSMVFLGRIDDQVKVRGFRIELGEVEQVVKQLSGVDQVCVIAVGEDQDRCLAAFIVPEYEQSELVQGFTEQVQTHLMDRLPDYMIPSFINVIEALPLTPNGKIDKKALSQLGFVRNKNDKVAPQNDLEFALHAVWANLLPVTDEQFGTMDDFFSLGGHSLLAVRFCSEIGKQLAVQFSIKEVFSHPTIQQQAELIAKKKGDYAGLDIPLVSRNALHYPLSFAQKRIWFLAQMETAQHEYNMPASIEVTGNFILHIVEQALQHILMRHELLRCNFVTVDGSPVVVIGEKVGVSVEQYDLTKLSGPEQQQALFQLKHKNARMKFDLSHDRLLKVSFVQLQNDFSEVSGVLLFNMHHIVSDGWSLGILLREFMQSYQSIAMGEAIQSPALPIQYIDYACWQHEYFQGERINKQLSYWEQLMANAPSSHGLPLDRKRGEVDRVGTTFKQVVPVDICGQINEQLATTQSTLFMFMQAAFALLIGRISHEYDVILGAPVAGRNHHQFDALIGLFLNTQLYRTEFTDNPSWLQLLARTRQQHLESAQFNDVPFEMIVEKLNPVRDLYQSPLFQILINYDNTENIELQLEDCEFRSQEQVEQANKYDITLYIYGDIRSGVELHWSYDQALFDTGTIAFYADEFGYLLQQLLAEPALPVQCHSWQHSRLWQSVLPGHSYVVENQFFNLIEQQVKRRPTAPALSYKNKRLTYGQLLGEVNQLANYLWSQGFRPGHRAAIFITRNELRVLSILAVLKLGGCYVPLSQELPETRVTYMLENSAVAFLLTDEESFQCHSSWLQGETYQTLVLDQSEIATEIRTHAIDLTVQIVAANSEAHIIFTSGSTGKPKGVLGTYGATANRIQWMLNTFPFTENESMAHITSMAFIRGVWELLVPLCGGAHLVLCSRETVKDTQQLWQWTLQHNINRMVTAPSLMKALCDVAKDSGMPMPLSYWFVSGEPLLQSHANDVLLAFPPIRLINLYGSTEVMSDVLAKEVSMEQSRSWVPVGQAIDNVAVFILEDNNLPAPDKVVGEIAVAGVGLSNGYLRTDQVGQQTFFDTPIGKVYRTGDMGYYKSNGDIEFLGRQDDQVKIRGYRIELGEVTTVINQYSDVKTCYVRAIKMQGEYILVAYIVLHNSEQKTQQVFLGNLKQQMGILLPPYMHPSFYLFLPELPLRPNGKVDRQALPQPNGVELQQEKIAPANNTEKQIILMWAELLELDADHIGVTTSFFDLGGHSLLVTRLMKKLEEQYKLILSYKDFFGNNTIRYLAEKADKARLLEEVLSHKKNCSSKKNNKLVI